MTPQAEDSARLEKLLGDLYADRAPRPETQSAVIDVVLNRLQCGRVSVWKFAGTEADLTLLCFASKTAAGVFDTSDRRLRRDEFIAYFNGLVGSGTHLSVDAMTDPLLQPMRESYLVANKLVSMLDAAFVLNNRTYGMVCCEEQHRREWQPNDVASLGDRQQARTADVERTRLAADEESFAAAARAAGGPGAADARPAASLTRPSTGDCPWAPTNSSRARPRSATTSAAGASPAPAAAPSR